MSSFNVVVHDLTLALEDWGKVLNTPVSKLPALTPERKASAKAWGVIEEEERRSSLYQHLREQRHQQFENQGRTLGKAVQNVLDVLDSPHARYRVWAVIVEAAEGLWLVRMETPQGSLALPVEPELRERIVSRPTKEAQEELRRQVLKAVGRTEFLAGQRGQA